MGQHNLNSQIKFKFQRKLIKNDFREVIKAININTDLTLTKNHKLILNPNLNDILNPYLFRK
mgnify:CR=1 FL=1